MFVKLKVSYPPICENGEEGWASEEFTEFIRNLLMLIFLQGRTNLVNGIKQPDGTIKALTVRQVAELLGHSTTQVTEMYYVKKDMKMLDGVTNDFCLWGIFWKINIK